MNVDTIMSVGCCIHDSEQGLMAFDFALGLAGRLSVSLVAYRFLDNPFETETSDTAQKTWYDESLEDETDSIIPHVRCLTCKGTAWDELNRRFGRREFQLLALPIPDYSTTFQGRSFHEIALRFLWPTVLVGPSSVREYYLNNLASQVFNEIELLDDLRLRADSHGLPS